MQGNTVLACAAHPRICATDRMHRQPQMMWINDWRKQHEQLGRRNSAVQLVVDEVHEARKREWVGKVASSENLKRQACHHARTLLVSRKFWL